ncbi:MAG: DUF3108 domain-containing protein [Micavibrio aeruginosavorus]|uniref:DUF3108 domain-containing protein n=1 Tax=Micavibrio aeruginosavorus TaxID=349221 RepID=A0A2W5PWE5_9BACT|nr:MAG: DUF3108 domain-containing protein [Micavibrio aeruginosavorus]
MTAHKVSRHSRKVWVGALCAMLAVTANVSPVFAAEKSSAKPASVSTDKQLMEYDVYAGGFHVVSSDLTVDLSKKNTYMLRLAAYTHGMLAKLAPWKGAFQTDGWYNAKKDAGQPKLHFSDTVWRDERELTEFEYNKNGSFKEYRITNKKEKGAKPLEPGLADDSTDVLTSTLHTMVKVAQGGKCEGTDKIFDGSRSYNLVFKEVGKAMLEATKLNVYSGPAIECTVEVKPLKGKWHEKPRGWMSIQEQGRERGTMPTIWLAQMAPGEAAVPVKIRVKTDYGTLFMHLTGYKGAGKTLKLAQ